MEIGVDAFLILKPSFMQYKELQKLYNRLEAQYCDSDYLTNVEQRLIKHYPKHAFKKKLFI